MVLARWLYAGAGGARSGDEMKINFFVRLWKASEGTDPTLGVDDLVGK